MAGLMSSSCLRLAKSNIQILRQSISVVDNSQFVTRNSIRSLMHQRLVLKSQASAASTSTQYHYHIKPKEHHDKLWAAERYLSLGLLAAIPTAALVNHPIMDHVLALSLVLHVHWGVEGIVTDYIRPSVFGPTIPKIAIGLVYLLSSLALGGLFMFNHTDVGITQATRMLAKM